MTQELTNTIRTSYLFIDNIPVDSGQYLFTIDTKQLYVDFGGQRIPCNLNKIFNNNEERINYLIPTEGFYYVDDDTSAWRYTGMDWIQLTDAVSNPLYFGPYRTFPKIGKPDELYIDDNIAFRWDEEFKDYLSLSSDQAWIEMEEV